MVRGGCAVLVSNHTGRAATPDLSRIGGRREGLEERGHCGQHHGPVSCVDIAGLATLGDGGIGEQLAAIVPGYGRGHVSFFRT